MARETKIGIALMILLVGVFGFMVYKKWQDQQPSAVAAGEGEADPATVAQTDDPPAEEHTAPEAPVASATPALDDNPFPAASSEAAPFRREAEFENPFAAVAETEPTESDTAPPAQGTEPPAQPIPLFAEEPSPFADENPLTANAEPRAMPAETVSVEGDSLDPFAEAAVSDTGPTESTPIPQASASATASAPAADPFGELNADPFAEAPDASTADVKNPATDAADASFAAAAQPSNGSTEPAASGSPFTESTLDASPFGELASDDSAPADVASASPFQDEPTAAMPANSTAAATDGAPLAGSPFAEDKPVIAENDSPPSSLANDEIEPFEEPETKAAAPEQLFPSGTTVPVARSIDDSATEDAFAASEPEETPFEPEPTAQPRAGKSDVYVVASNDSYWSISKRVYGTPIYFHALSKYNLDRIPDPNRLRPGMKILTPPEEELARRYPTLVSKEASSEQESKAERVGFAHDAQGRPVYRVGKSDTLTGIAQSHLGRASRWVQIYELNRKAVPDPKSLRPGTVLLLPADASRVKLVPED